MITYYDAHCHYSNLGKIYNDFFIAAVSVDYRSSLKTLALKTKNILKGMGMHPWYINKLEVKKILKTVQKADFIGEVGLDFKYSKVNREIQKEIFNYFINISKEMDKTLNIHAYAAWKEAFRLLLRNDVKRAILHWYNGPLELLKDIEGAGYFITINPSFTYKEKHRKVLEKASLEIILTESDGGYVYNKTKGINKVELLERIEKNLN